MLLNYIEQYQLKIKHTTWKIAPVLGRVSPDLWNDPNTYSNVVYNRYNSLIDVPMQYANNIDSIMPEIPYMLNQLPFTQLTFGFLLEQLQEVTKHHDVQKYDVYNDLNEISIENEPRRFNILLNRHSEPAFYVSETLDTEKVYPNITKETPCFAFNERQYLHGSDYIGSGKVMLIAGGLIDKEKFKDTISKNLERFKDQTIIFSDTNYQILNPIGSGIEKGVVE